MKTKTITEGSATIKTAKETKVSKKLPVFYNPIMKLNRDISILLLNTISKKDMQIALPLAGSGIRGIRFIKELKKNKIKNISFNDYSKEATESISANLELNNIKNKKLKPDRKGKIKNKIEITDKDADLFLLGSNGFDYIDIDPFGTPNPFLDSAVKRIAREGILAITATDTSALAGTYENACKRKYWAKPLLSGTKHEIGIRILIRKVQLIGAQYEKALTPIFSHSSDHYMRVYFLAEKGKTKVDKILKQHGMYKTAGPLWTGQLWDKTLAAKMLKNNPEPNNSRLLGLIAAESKIDAWPYYDIHSMCKKLRISAPKLLTIKEKIKIAKYKSTESHFCPFTEPGLRSNIPEDELIVILKKLSS